VSQSSLLSYGEKLSREQLAFVPTPPGTAAYVPIPHREVVSALIETLGFRHIAVVRDEYAVSKGGLRMFGVLDLDIGMHGCQFSIGLCNAHDRSMRLAMTEGYKVFVCENLAFYGNFQPVIARHSKSFSLQNALSIGVDHMQRNFDCMRAQVNRWHQSELSDVEARLIIYRAFIESELEVPKHLARPVHDLYFNPQHEEFQPRTMWSLSNAFTSVFKQLNPIPRFRATVKLGAFLERS